MSLVSGALGYLLADASITTVIPGTRSLEHLRASVDAVAEPLPQETVDAIRHWYAGRLGDQPALSW